MDTPAAEQAVDKLQSLSQASIPKVIALLGTTRREETDLVIQLLHQMLSQNLLQYYLDGLSDPDARIVSGVVKVLQDAQNIDPNGFLELLDNPDISKPAILQLLSAQKEGLDAKKILRYAYKLQHNDLVMLYRIIDDIADESLIPELINRIDTKDPVMKTQITKVLSKFKSKPVQNDSIPIDWL